LILAFGNEIIGFVVWSKIKQKAGEAKLFPIENSVKNLAFIEGIVVYHFSY
jgi:hypothetical protein